MNRIRRPAEGTKSARIVALFGRGEKLTIQDVISQLEEGTDQDRLRRDLAIYVKRGYLERCGKRAYVIDDRSGSFRRWHTEFRAASGR
jgi:Fic family protein